MLLFLPSPETKFWSGLVALFVLGLGYIGFRLTKGFIGGYLKADIGDEMKSTLLVIHGLGSLILALILPNNYLIDIDVLRDLYNESEIWIAASILTLLFVFILLFGTIFTLVTIRRFGNLKDIKK